MNVSFCLDTAEKSVLCVLAYAKSSSLVSMSKYFLIPSIFPLGCKRTGDSRDNKLHSSTRKSALNK